MAENYFAELNEINCNDKTEKKGKRLFVARLHLNGDVIIGKYTTEI